MKLRASNNPYLTQVGEEEFSRWLAEEFQAYKCNGDFDVYWIRRDQVVAQLHQEVDEEAYYYLLKA